MTTPNTENQVLEPPERIWTGWPQMIYSVEKLSDAQVEYARVRAGGEEDADLISRKVAEEIAANYEVHKDHCHSNERYPSPPCDCGAIEEIVTIVNRHFTKGESITNER